MKIKMMIGLSLTVVNIGFAASNTTLCQADEEVIFSCANKNKKIVSMCASKPLTATQGTLQYRFGTKGHIELAYPADAMSPAKAFEGRAQMFSGGGGVYLRFKKDKYDYVLYNGIGKGWLMNGLVLFTDSKFTSYFACANRGISEISPQLLETLQIPKDADDKEFFPGDIPSNLISR